MYAPSAARSGGRRPCEIQQQRGLAGHSPSRSSSEIFRAAVRLEEASPEPYSLEQIASNLGVSLRVRALASSQHGPLGEPITLVWKKYEWDPEKNGNRTLYRLPAGVAHVLRDL